MAHLTRNRARCKKCGDVVESRSVHDFQGCSCGAIFVDGGLEYQRWGGEPENFEDLSEWAEGPPPKRERKPLSSEQAEALLMMLMREKEDGES